MACILIADDEARIRRLVGDFLRRDGHEIIEAMDGNDAIAQIAFHRPNLDLIILDVMMPGADGFAVLRHIRNTDADRTIPVMLLTARSEEFDQLTGLDSGADDYVTKPFSPLVLAARVKALLKRTTNLPEKEVTAYGGLTIDEVRHAVAFEGTEILLTPKEYELLIYFKNNRGVALSREMILNAVWGYDYFGDLRTVDTHIKKLRAKLGTAGNLVGTVRGYGYRFEG